MCPFRIPVAFTASLMALAAHAQPPGMPNRPSTGTGNGLPPARPLGAVDARAPEPFGALANVRALPGGRLLVNDPVKRRVLLVDSTLTTFAVVADSTSTTGNAYAGRFGGLIPYRGDSTLFVDPVSLSMLLIDPAGKLGRTMAVPRPGEAATLVQFSGGTPGFDAHGRLVYRGQPTVRMSGAPGAGTMTPVLADSAPLVRVDLTTRRLDTLTFLTVAVPRISLRRKENGDVAGVDVKTNPLPVVDDWAVLSDGTVMVLRGRDFHADLVGADGVLRSAPKMPHDWQRLSDEDKVAFLDSTRAALEKQRAETQARVAAGTVGGAVSGAVGGSAPAGGGGGVVMTVVISANSDGTPPSLGGGAPPPRAGATASTTSVPPINLVPASELPDYKPPFAAGAVRADMDGHVWVRLIATTPLAGPVYDVIDGQGRVVDRVVLPPNSAIAGFGPRGVVYLGVRESGALHLVRARAR